MSNAAVHFSAVCPVHPATISTRSCKPNGMRIKPVRIHVLTFPIIFFSSRGKWWSSEDAVCDRTCFLLFFSLLKVVRLVLYYLHYMFDRSSTSVFAACSFNTRRYLYIYTCPSPSDSYEKIHLFASRRSVTALGLSRARADDMMDVSGRERTREILHESDNRWFRNIGAARPIRCLNYLFPFLLFNDG